MSFSTIEKNSPSIICTIIPPHMSKKNKEFREKQDVQELAQRHLKHSENFRAHRTNMPIYRAETVQVPSFLIYNADHSTDPLPGKELSADDVAALANTGDQDPQQALYGSQKTYECYKNVFNRNSMDNHGQNIISTVHYDKKYDNAFWNGEQMVYGDGDGEVFGNFTSCLDVIGHELTHGVTQNLSNLTYKAQSGALNEHFSDVGGKIVEHYTKAIEAEKTNASPELNDIIGKGLLLPYEGVEYLGLRSMANPGTAYINHPVLGTDPQPGRMSDYVNTEEDDEGVHINSGIPSHAFWLFHTDLQKEGIGKGNLWDIPGQIWYDTAQKIDANCDFKGFAKQTLKSVSSLKEVLIKEGVDYQRVKNLLRKAWQTVELPL